MPITKFAGHYIAGKFTATSGTKTLKVLHKYTQQTLCELPYARTSDIETALDCASKAKASLAKLSGGQRSQFLKKLSDLIGEHAEPLAQLICAEAGKPIDYARAEISRCQTTLDLAGRDALSFSGEMIPMHEGAAFGKTAFTKRFPIGVVVGISPFNFPLNLALHKIAPAIAAGCPIIVKPSPFSPLTSFAFANLCKLAGLPLGCVQILLCEDSDAAALSTDPRVSLVSFTGSPMVGWKIKKSIEKAKVQLELGGNAAVLVDDDADLQTVANQVSMGALLYAGQICISTQRVFVVKSVFEAFKNELIKACEQIKCGDPSDPATVVGPLIAPIHYERITNWINEAKTQGAKVLFGGEGLDASKNLYGPTLLTNTDKSMKVFDEEVFGPVMVIESVADFSQGLSRINDSRFGLQAGVFTNKIDRMQEAFESLEVGGVMINNVPGYRVDHMPYGGIKDSGLGREGIKYAMQEMTEARILIY